MHEIIAEREAQSCTLQAHEDSNSGLKSEPQIKIHSIYSKYQLWQNAVWSLPFINKAVRFSTLYNLQLRQICSRKDKHHTAAQYCQYKQRMPCYIKQQIVYLPFF